MGSIIRNGTEEYDKVVSFVKLIEDTENIREKYRIIRLSPEVECCKEEVKLLISIEGDKISRKLTVLEKELLDYVQEGNTTNNENHILMSRIISFQNEISDVNIFLLNQIKEQNRKIRLFQRHFIVIELLISILFCLAAMIIAM